MSFFSSLFGSGSKPANGSTPSLPAAAAAAPPPPPSLPLPLQTQTPPADPPRVSAVEAWPQQSLETKPSPLPTKRTLKQFGLFCGGASFMVFSIIISRRAVAKHMRASQLKFYQPNHNTGRRGDAAKELEGRNPLVAFEALNLATLNMISFAVMATGGLSWALDVSSVDDLRRMARRSMDLQGGDADEAAEKEVAEWVAKMLGSKEEAPSKDVQSKP